MTQYKISAFKIGDSRTIAITGIGYITKSGGLVRFNQMTDAGMTIGEILLVKEYMSDFDGFYNAAKFFKDNPTEEVYSNAGQSEAEVRHGE
jgi:hypothetical protein